MPHGRPGTTVRNVADEASTVLDGYLSFEGGVDSGFAPSLLRENEQAWAINASCRGGFLKPRPGYKYRRMSFPDAATQAAATNALFQGAGTYVNDDGLAFLVHSAAGRIFATSVDDFVVNEITIPGDPNSPIAQHAWFQQAENTLIVQNRIQPPFFWNGVSSRRSIVNTQVPIGGPMAYLKGRLWVADGNDFYGGDLVNSYPALGRESVLQFEENTFLNEGGAFSANGHITALAVGANIDTQLGDGDLLIFTIGRTYAFNAPADRDLWKKLTYPIQRVALTTAGTYSQESVVHLNEDLIFRSGNGINSFKYAKADFQQWGNSPISRQVERALRYDTDEWLSECSAANFDNRMLMTVQPERVQGKGFVHRGLAVLDYHLVSGMGRKTDPAWEGVWTGLRILRVLTVLHRNTFRGFIYALDDDDKICLWEMTKEARFDVGPDGEDVRIAWGLESKSFTYGKPRQQKKLLSLEQWYDQLTGQFNVKFQFKSNLSDCWTDWAEWSACAKYKDCNPPVEGVCNPVRYLRQQVRPRMALPQPPDVVDVQTGGFRNQGYDFQVRMVLTGYARLNRLITSATIPGDMVFGDFRGVTCVATAAGACDANNCKELVCCDPDDYTNLVPTPAPPGGFVSGRVYLRVGEADAGFPGATVRLFADDNGDGVPNGPGLETVMTATSGLYLFNNLEAGSYVIRVTIPAGYAAVARADSTVDSPLNPVDAAPYAASIPVTLAAGETDSGNDFYLSTI